MRIVSDFRDFYDVGASWDTEPKPLFLRHAEVTSASRVSGRWKGDDEATVAAGHALERWMGRFELPFSEYIDVVVVGFCGVVRQIVRHRGETHHTLEGVEKALLADDHARDMWSGWGRYESGVRDLASWGLRFELEGEGFEGAPVQSTSPLFRALGTPIFLIENIAWNARSFRLTRNPNLRELGVHKVIDPYTAWQRLDGYLSNELAVQVDPPNPISDELRRDIHGFDKRSFKAEPGGPTRKRKKKR